MALVACIGTSRAQAGVDAGAVDLVAADRLEQAVSRVRHMAIVTLAARRIDTVSRVLRQPIRTCEVTMALHTGRVVFPADAQLVVRPLVTRPSIFRILM